MTKTDAKKRIKKALKKLNDMDNKLLFSMEETKESIGINCNSKTKDGVHFGAYEFIAFFDEYKKDIDAYKNCILYAEVMVAATKLNDKKAYHNVAF